jgi:tetratricopeptide (TPR) repeat protein
MDEDIQIRLDAMKKEIDALQVAVMTDNKPWYKSASILISLFALLFSFGTTAVSYYKSGQEEIRSARAELRSMLQRLTALPKDNFELIRKYKDDPEGQGLSSTLNYENSILARQASEIIDRYPNEVSASEYLSVISALLYASDFSKVPQYLEKCLSLTSDPNIRVAALRTFAVYLMNTGKVLEGRHKFEEALSVWNDYKNLTDYFKNNQNAQTEMFWAQTELGIRNLEAAKEHIRKSIEIAKALPAGPLTAQIQGQVFYTQNIIEHGWPSTPLNTPK